MSTRLVPVVVCLGTFVLLMDLTAAGAGRPHQGAPRTGSSRIQRLVGDVAPVPVPVPVVVGVCRSAARRGAAAP